MNEWTTNGSVKLIPALAGGSPYMNLKPDGGEAELRLA